MIMSTTKTGGESMFKRISLVLLSLLVVSASIFAVGPWSYGSQESANFERQATPLYQNLPEGASVSEITLTGVIKEIKVEPGDGTEIVIDVDGKEYEVHAGPIWLYGDLKEGMEIEITGRLVTLSDETFVGVDKAIVDGKEVVVRENGFPVFAKKGSANNGTERGMGKMENYRAIKRGKNMRNNTKQNVVQNRGNGGQRGHGNKTIQYRNGTCVYNAR